MTIRIQTWAEGTTASADVDTTGTGITITDIDVLECYPSEAFRSYVTKTGLDGTNKAWHRKYLTATIVFSSLSLSTSATRSSVMAILGATYYRVKDARHASLGAGNSVVFVKANDSKGARADKTLLSETYTLELISQSTVA